ncbi:MAG: hypothetical protein IPK16_20705 [Anaerolineales bacterium]|nr:hypothetical protein [Anaerolineales bacterium]
MQIVKLQCPACGAAITAPQTGREFACSYCGTQLAAVQEGGGASLVETKPEIKAPVQAPTPVTVAVPNHSDANGRGCIAALIMWLIGGPLVVSLLMLPIVMIAPTDAEGQVIVPDAVSACVGLSLVGIPLLLAVYAFVYFRRRENSVWGYFTTPFRLMRRRK